MAKQRRRRRILKAARQQARLVANADAAADAADGAIRRIWREVLKVLKKHREPWIARNTARVILAKIKLEVQRKTGAALRKAAKASYAYSVDEIKKLPHKYLRHAAMRKEGIWPPPPGVNVVARIAGVKAKKADYADILFPPPSEEMLDRVLNTGRALHGAHGPAEPWHVQLRRATRLADPDVLSQVIGNGIAAGKTPREVAKDLMPHVNNVRVSARRIARTEGVRIGHAMQQEAHRQLGDLVIGYTVHSVHGNPNSRSWHLKRDGTEYYKNPTNGQKGYHQMPHPPEEADDPSERPVGTPKTAYNCLCYLSPVLRPL